MLTSVDLFAGCGGLSLGLELAGFETIFVNELHPVALDTYLRNRPKSRVQDVRNQSGDILALTSREGELESLARRLRREAGGDVSLVVGGPPCQGYSGIGHRRSFKVWKEDVPGNYLYREMAKVVAAVAPRAFVFENVRGLMTGRWTPAGEPGEIWRDIQHEFERVTARRGRQSLDYEIKRGLVFASDFGVPQNRPRVLIIGIRSDVATGSRALLAGAEPLPGVHRAAPDLVDLLGDLIDSKWSPGGSTTKYQRGPSTPIQVELRTTPNGHVLTRGDTLIDQEYARHRPEIVEKFQYMIDHDGAIPASMRTKKFAQRVLPRRWGERGPTITATSLPDDYVHFSQPRVPTVREWARLQTFPDWYEFSGRRTTGGRRRAGDPSADDWSREVPKFTQIGNAVPVTLARAIGEHLRTVLD